MCGRYTIQTTLEELMAMFALDRIGDVHLTPNYNVAPSHAVPAIIEEGGERLLAEFHWGLIPFWAKDTKIGFKMINARAESVFTKPAYKGLAKRRRAIIPADGFYEWQKSENGKQPYRFVLKNGDPFGFAGLWDEWDGPDGPLRSCTIITTKPNKLVKEIHDRMPVMLSPDALDAWLDPHEEDPDRLAKLLVPYDADQMKRYPVSKEVGSVKNTGAALIEEIPLNSK
ncbi:Putative SOS response-associated peptidase YedK [Cohnella sp. OV330]|uniref:SOS response-associated peptidase n=1 Tax=Cohnella sp. OV330 TaxID=1855288 RepID=UPI0008E3D339|nr:SOS response-associated peptidase [Cohnella sp. OV330]SFB58166.1 Putative SOS response-associated peptidase YedK [Cohnella sp. OV330]